MDDPFGKLAGSERTAMDSLQAPVSSHSPSLTPPSYSSLNQKSLLLFFPVGLTGESRKQDGREEGCQVGRKDLLEGNTSRLLSFKCVPPKFM